MGHGREATPRAFKFSRENFCWLFKKPEKLSVRPAYGWPHGVLIQLSAKFPVLSRFYFPQFTCVSGYFAKRLLQTGMQVSVRKNPQNGADPPKGPFPRKSKTTVQKPVPGLHSEQKKEKEEKSGRETPTRNQFWPKTEKRAPKINFKLKLIKKKLI